MKKLNKIKLNYLYNNEIEDREQRMLKGGYDCGCVSMCLQDFCACVDEVGSTPNEAAMYRVTTTKDSQDNYNSIFENVKK